MSSMLTTIVGQHEWQARCTVVVCHYCGTSDLGLIATVPRAIGGWSFPPRGAGQWSWPNWKVGVVVSLRPSGGSGARLRPLGVVVPAEGRRSMVVAEMEGWGGGRPTTIRRLRREAVPPGHGQPPEGVGEHSRGEEKWCERGDSTPPPAARAIQASSEGRGHEEHADGGAASPCRFNQRRISGFGRETWMRRMVRKGGLEPPHP